MWLNIISQTKKGTSLQDSFFKLYKTAIMQLPSFFQRCITYKIMLVKSQS